MLLMKLENLKKGLIFWAGNIRVSRRRKRQILTNKLTKLMSNDQDERNMAEMIDTRIQLNFKIKKDECYWEQRVRLNWLKFGDRNTAFFHNSASQR